MGCFLVAIRFYFFNSKKADGKRTSLESFCGFPVLLSIPLSGRKTSFTAAPDGAGQPGRTPGAHLHHPAQQTASTAGRCSCLPAAPCWALLPRSPGLAPAGLEDEEGEPAARERAVGRRGAPAQWQPSCSSRGLRSSFAPQTPPNLTATLGRRPGLWRLPHFVAADTLGLGSEATCPRPHRRDG